ncbi:MAG: hypothetical protein DRI84_07395 [Bacteroidetes bacterium]|nr:MAG: hypothetical protein DRI84_07395 [Bacteroidota bacterium]
MLNSNRSVRIPLFWKFAIISTIIVVLFGSVNVYLLWTSVYKTFDREIDQRIKVLAKIVSDKALNPMVYGESLDLNNILDEVKQSDSSIVYIFIIDSTNELVAKNYDIRIPTGLLDANSLNSGQHNIKVIKTSNYKFNTIRDIAFPILNGVGIVRLGITESSIQEQMKEATTNVIMMIIAFFAIGLGGAYIFSYIITTPIKEISKRAQVIGLSHLEYNDYNIETKKFLNIFNITVNDEMDVLISKFSEMITRLKASYTELKATQGALIQAEKLASLGTLAAGVAHEINNPISGIKNCTNRIIKNPENQQQNQIYMELIKEATDRIENVVQHLLKFSRKQEFVFEKVNLNLVIDNAILLTEYKLQRSNFNVKTSFDDVYFVSGSANHLEQVFVNLILNSLDAILERIEKDPEVKGEIEVGINQSEDRVFITFKDNGLGIPAEMQGKIYDPFFTSKEVGKGTGLGLSVSFNIINEHKGKISFNTVVGHGTEFIIELPYHEC